MSDRIGRIEAWPVNVPLDAPYEMAPGTYWGMSRTVVRVTTTDGVVGVGETPSVTDAAPLLGELGESVLGRPVGDVRRELDRHDRLVRTATKVADDDPGRALMGVGVALWDIEAKVAGIPLADLVARERRLTGQLRRSIPCSEYFAFRRPGPAATGEATPEEVADHCGHMAVEHGSTIFEGKVAVRSPEEEARLVGLVRAAIGPDAELRLDANQGWRVETAARFLLAVAEHRIANVEEPCLTFAETAELRRVAPHAASITFSTHDPDLAASVDLGTPEILVLNVAACGSIPATIAFMEACHRAGRGFWFYSGDLGPATALHLHLSAALPEIDRASQSLLRWYPDDVIVGGPLVPRHNVVDLPTGPGLGVELDDVAIARGVERFAREGEYRLYDGPALPRW